MTLSDSGGNAILVVRAAASERGHGCRHLVEQGAGLRAVVDLLHRQRRRDDLAGVGVYADVQLIPTLHESDSEGTRRGEFLVHCPPLRFA